MDSLKIYNLAKIQVELAEAVDSYLSASGMTQEKFQKKCGISNAKMQQVLGCNFDGKLSELVTIMDACKKQIVMGFQDWGLD